MVAVLFFVHGFLAPPSAYTELLAPLRGAGIEVATPSFYGALAGLTGRYSATQEADDLAAMVRSMSAPTGRDTASDRPWLAGHSRGGQVAWRAAEILGSEIGGLIVIDPVDGAGPRATSTTARATDHPASIRVPTLIIGAGRGGSCAPSGLNHEVFAAALPEAAHIVIDDMGHADMLSGRALAWGRRLCGGGSDPARCRRELSDLMLEWVPRPPGGVGSP